MLFCCKIRLLGCPAGGTGWDMRVSESGRAPQQDTAPPYANEVTVGGCTPASAWEAGVRPRGPDYALQGGHKEPHVMHNARGEPKPSGTGNNSAIAHPRRKIA